MKKIDVFNEEEFVIIGEIVAPHGIKGEIRVYPLSDNNEFLLKFKKIYLGSEKEEAKVEKSRLHKNIVIFKLENIDDRTMAAKYLKNYIFVKRSDINLEEGRFFINDLIGVKVFDADTGLYYGDIEKITQMASSDIYNIKSEDGNLYMIPAVEEFIINIDIENKTMKVRPIEGLFDINN